MEKPQSGCQQISLNNHSIVQAEWLFFYLLKITTNAIIKAIAFITQTQNFQKNTKYNKLYTGLFAFFSVSFSTVEFFSLSFLVFSFDTIVCVVFSSLISLSSSILFSVCIVFILESLDSLVILFTFVLNQIILIY